MSFVDRNDMVQTLAPDAPDHSFRVTILPRASRRGPNLLNAHSFDRVVEPMTVNPISVSNQIAWRRVVRKGFDDLLSGPFCRWMLRDIEVNELATVVDQHIEYKQDSQSQRRNRKDIHRNKLAHMVMQKRLPRL